MASMIPFNPFFLLRVDYFELSRRTTNVLAATHAVRKYIPGSQSIVGTWSATYSVGPTVYIGDLVQKTEQDMLRLPNFGRVSLNEIKWLLQCLDLYLGTEVPNWPREGFRDIVVEYLIEAFGPIKTPSQVWADGQARRLGEEL